MSMISRTCIKIVLTVKLNLPKTVVILFVDCVYIYITDNVPHPTTGKYTVQIYLKLNKQIITKLKI